MYAAGASVENQDILRLNITVSDGGFSCVEISQRRKQLAEDLGVFESRQVIASVEGASWDVLEG